MSTYELAIVKNNEYSRTIFLPISAIHFKDVSISARVGFCLASRFDMDGQVLRGHKVFDRSTLVSFTSCYLETLVEFFLKDKEETHKKMKSRHLF